MISKRSGLLCASALASVMAIHAAPAAAQDTEVSEVVITGSRIAAIGPVAKIQAVAAG